MSNVTISSFDKEKKRPSVSSKCLSNIKSIVSQNVSSNSNCKNACLRSPTSVLPPLPLVDLLVSPKEAIHHLHDKKEIEEKKRKTSQSFPNRNALIDYLHKSSNKQIIPTNGHDRLNFENGKSTSTSVELTPQVSTSEKTHGESQSNFEQCSTSALAPVNNNELSIIPPLPLNISMHPFGSSSSSHHTKPLLSFPVQSSNRINEEYLTRMRHIIASSNSLNEAKPIELSIHQSQSIPIHRLDFASSTIKIMDGDEDDEIDLSGPLIFVNSALSLSMDSTSAKAISDRTMPNKLCFSERSEKEFQNNRKVMNNHTQHHQSNPRCSTSFVRLPHSLRNRNPSFNHPSSPGAIQSPINNHHHPSLRRQFPKFESVRTPVQKSPVTKQASPSTIPSELLDCCQTETIPVSTEIIITQHNVTQRNSHRKSKSTENGLNESEARSNYFRDVAKIREVMINVSKRLRKDNDSMPGLPIVDTHCHFDLIFDRLRIRHNDLKKYFNDYNEFYPSGLSFELAIQVFWRPKQLAEDNWVNWYSKYLDDDRVYGSCGIHPHWSSAWTETSVTDIERCLKHPKIVAIGEIGLDYGPKNTCLKHEQRRAFEAQLKLAAKWLKPIVIHSRDAYPDTFQLMKQYLTFDHKIHLHCFVGTMDDVHLFTSYFTEIKFGFTPIITHYNFLHTVIQQLELTQILSETDSPYFTPEELSTLSRCSHPGMVYSVVEMVAQLRYLPVIDMACQLRENARHMYGV